jgi:hypothetical protein
MVNGVITSIYFHDKSESATPSEQYGEWGNNINLSSLGSKICLRNQNPPPPLNNMEKGK